MKIDFIKTIIAIGISALLAYACYEICDFEKVRTIITAGAFITIFIPCQLSIGMTSDKERGGIMIKTLSWIILFIEVVANLVFSFFDFSIPVYIILNGILLLIYALIANSIYRTKM